MRALIDWATSCHTDHNPPPLQRRTLQGILYDYHDHPSLNSRLVGPPKCTWGVILSSQIGIYGPSYLHLRYLYGSLVVSLAVRHKIIPSFRLVGKTQAFIGGVANSLLAIRRRCYEVPAIPYENLLWSRVI